MRCYLAHSPLGISVVVFPHHPMRRIIAKLRVQKSAAFNGKNRGKGFRNKEKEKA